MAQTIGNPGSWFARLLGQAGHHVTESARQMGSDQITSPPRLRKLTQDDLRAALRAGWQDFTACRTDVLFLVLLYPVMGLVLMGIGLQMSLVPLLFPLVAGFALLGPVAAVGCYEISRRREAGDTTRWYHALSFVENPGFGAIVVLGLYLAAIFLVWMVMAAWIYGLTLGPGAPASIGAFLSETLTTARGWTMILFGCSVGFLLAFTVLAVSVISFPMLLDRKTGLPVAVTSSIQLTRENPRVVLSWGGIVTAGLILGSLPMLLGLVIVLPVLGHATWHLYRRAVQ